MKTQLLFCCLAAWAAAGSSATPPPTSRTLRVELANLWDKAKTDEPVVLRLSDIAPDLPVLSAIVRRDNEEIPSQLDDFDGDRIPDELAFVIDLPAKSRTTVCITLSTEKNARSYPARVYAQMLFRTSKAGKYAKGTSVYAQGDADTYNILHHHGIAFESELNAWRIYFNEKQTTDLYGKFHKGLEIAESLFYPTDEQLARGFGDDVIKVKNSCGAGTLKGWNGTAATHLSPVSIRGQRIIASGPVRTVVDAEVRGWQYQGQELNMINRYTLYAGHRDAQVEVIFDRPLHEEVFATGVQRIAGADAAHFSDHKGLVASWGTDWPVNDTVKYKKETVGLGTYIPRQLVVNEATDAENYLYVIQATGQSRFSYHTTFTSRKETFGYTDAPAWFDYLLTWKDGLDHPVELKILRP